MTTYYLALTTCNEPIELTFKKDEYTLDSLHEMYSTIYQHEYIGTFTTHGEAQCFIEIYKEESPKDDSICYDFDKILFLENCLLLNSNKGE